jgi:Ice-binding-like
MKLFTISLLALSLSGIGAYAQTDSDTVKINLGAADKFGLLGGSGVTNVSAHTFIIGDVGSSPTPTVKGIKPSQVKGQLFLKSSPVTAAAQKGLTTAYNQAASAHCGTTLTGVNLGGMKLIPGVYCFTSAAQLTGTLKLDAQGNSNAQWIFQIGTTLTTAPNSKVLVNLAGKGGRGCNVYWQVGSSATVGKGSIVVGKMMALTSVTLNGGVLRGKALARNGAISISAQETVDGPKCANAGAADSDEIAFSEN